MLGGPTHKYWEDPNVTPVSVCGKEPNMTPTRKCREDPNVTPVSVERRTFISTMTFFFYSYWTNSFVELCLVEGGCLNGGSCKGDYCECPPIYIGTRCEKVMLIVSLYW